MKTVSIKSSPISVSVEARYLPEQSDASESRFAFSYTITICNEGQQAAQLISRHWFITDALEQVQEVQGLGVIGEQPLIQPGDSYTYSSGAILETQTGTMSGSYQMLGADGENFDAPIELFTLIPPSILH